MPSSQYSEPIPYLQQRAQRSWPSSASYLLHRNRTNVGALPIASVVPLAIAALLFRLVAPRGAGSDRPAVAGLACSITGLLSVMPAFGSGVQIALDAAGSALNHAGRIGRRATGDGGVAEAESPVTG